LVFFWGELGASVKKRAPHIKVYELKYIFTLLCNNNNNNTRNAWLASNNYNFAAALGVVIESCVRREKESQHLYLTPRYPRANLIIRLLLASGRHPHP